MAIQIHTKILQSTTSDYDTVARLRMDYTEMKHSFYGGDMTENKKKKFVMNLVWHNCKTYPPSEDYNPALIITNGKEIFDMRWHKEDGFYVNCSGGYMCLNPKTYERWWWADIEQTVKGCSEFVITE